MKKLSKRKRTTGKSKEKKLKSSGWLTTDDYELELRRQRVKDEPMRVTPLTQDKTPYKDYLVARFDEEHNTEYLVELRSVSERINTCTCPDFKKNFLVSISKKYWQKPRLVEKAVHLISRFTWTAARGNRLYAFRKIMRPKRLSGVMSLQALF
jgi:hypothetical protein